MTRSPSDVDLAGIYFPPTLVVFLLGLAAMALTVYLLNRARLSRFFMFPLVVMTAITIIYMVVIGTFVIPM